MTLTFTAGSTIPANIPVTIPILDDAAVEESESFSVTLTADANIMVDPAPATVNIQDDGDSEFNQDDDGSRLWYLRGRHMPDLC